MATTEELLTAAEEASTDREYLEIDNDLRTITIPSSKKILGVESDDEVNRLYFRMPATYEDTDLSDFKVRINYQNANKVGDVYAVEDNESDGDYITFSWLAGRNATAYKGTVSFIVCLKLVDADTAEVTKEFNTTVSSLTVLEGLETTEAVIQENADIIEQMLLKLDNVGQPSAEDIAAAVTDYLDTNGVSVDIPETLPNPYALTLTGGASATYDGSKAVSVEIPEQTEVTVEQTLTSGTKIGSVNGTNLYAPSSSGGTTVEAEVTQLLTSGTAIATVNGTTIYAPSYTDGDEVSY